MGLIPQGSWYAELELYKSAIVQGIQLLLTDKHLYQNVNLKVPAFDGLDPVIKKMVCQNWHLATPSESFTTSPKMLIRLPSIRSFCKSCKERLPYNPFASHEVTWHDAAGNLLSQVFILTYACQGCDQATPETFMVRRIGNDKLVLCGRFPMEVVETPKVIPKDCSKFFSDATIAFNSGQTLAGLFLLRTFIEQFIIANTGKRLDVGGWENYGAKIPVQLKQTLPSLSDLYTKLSEAVHRAEDNADLFNETREKIVVHFEGLDFAAKASKWTPQRPS